MSKTRNIFLSRFELQNLPISTKILISKLLKNKDLPQLFFLWQCSTHYMRTTLYLYSHTQQSTILSSSSFWHHTKIRRFTMVCRSPHLLFSVRCYKKAIEKNSCVFSSASMRKIAKNLKSVKPVWSSDKGLEHFPHTNSTCACRTPSYSIYQQAKIELFIFNIADCANIHASLKWNWGKMLLAVLALSSWLSKINAKIMYYNFA